MIKLNDTKYVYPKSQFSVCIPSMEIAKGERVAIIGPSGSGKTTLLKLLSGILKPVSGSVSVDDLDLHLISDNARRAFRITKVGFIFQDFGLVDYLSVWDNILHPYRLNKALQLSEEVRDRARQLASDTGLLDRLNQKPGELSHGERQRTAICRALLPKPLLILADEPTGNLDPESKHAIMHLLADVVTADDATLVTVTHDHALLDGFDRVIDFADFHAGDPHG